MSVVNEPFTLRLIVNNILNESSAKDLINWSINLLEAGIETEELISLAGLSYSDNLFDVKESFNEALTSVGFSRDTEGELLLAYAKSIAMAIVNKEMSPTTGMQELNMLSTRCNIKGINLTFDLSEFSAIEDAIHMINNDDDSYLCVYETLRRGENEELIRNEAALFLQTLEKRIPEEIYREYAFCADCSQLMLPQKKKPNLIQNIVRPKGITFVACVCSNCRSENLIWVSSQEGRRIYMEKYS